MKWSGWKTYVGSAIIAGAALASYHGWGQYEEAIYAIGAALGISGLRHKMERMAPSDED
jgi:uncharacterized membrane protein YhiD involved in acid resistance